MRTTENNNRTATATQNNLLQTNGTVLIDHQKDEKFQTQHVAHWTMMICYSPFDSSVDLMARQKWRQLLSLCSTNNSSNLTEVFTTSRCCVVLLWTTITRRMKDGRSTTINNRYLMEFGLANRQIKACSWFWVRKQWRIFPINFESLPVMRAVCKAIGWSRCGASIRPCHSDRQLIGQVLCCCALVEHSRDIEGLILAWY